MVSDLVQFRFKKTTGSIIKVIGVGGGGCNAVNHMFESGIRDVDYIVCNTDAQALEHSPVPVKIQLGTTLTEGRGAGNQPDIGEEAARESYGELRALLEDNTRMVFLTAGLGGGTGTGAAPVIAGLAHDLGILTIAVVTIPSPSEGKKRYNQAIEGIKRLDQYTDSMLIVNNQRLHSIYGELPATQAFKLADEIVKTAVKGVAEIITLHGNINIDFADVYTVMHDSKVFIMGTGTASGPGRAMDAVKEALRSPLLDNNDIFGTKNILLNIVSGSDEITIGEIGEIIENLQNEAGQEADIIWGNGYDEAIGDKICVTILCTGFRNAPAIREQMEKTAGSFSLPGEPVKKGPVPAEAEAEKAREHLLILDPESLTRQEKTETVWSPPTVPAEKQPSRRQTRKNKNSRREENGGDSLENWFHRKFGKLFEEDDQQLDNG